uniref:PDZ domain-containing protein n=1 Tax=Syphacia muris TaxID=451379 RepID=A0A0N5AHF0_9BILA
MTSDDADLDILEATLNSIKICQKALLERSNGKSDSWIETHQRHVEVKCDSKCAPFTIYGGAECDQLILIDIVHHPDLLTYLATNDIVLGINSRKISGMVLDNVCAILNELFESCDTITLEVISEGKWFGFVGGAKPKQF